jgi:hypothetical protein
VDRPGQRSQPARSTRLPRLPCRARCIRRARLTRAGWGGLRKESVQIPAGQQGREHRGPQLVQRPDCARICQGAGDGGDPPVGGDSVAWRQFPPGESAVARDLLPRLDPRVRPAALGPAAGSGGVQVDDHCAQGRAKLPGGHRPGLADERHGHRLSGTIGQAGQFGGEDRRPGPVDPAL